MLSQIIVLVTTTLGFLITSTLVITSAKKDENIGIPFYQHYIMSARALSFANLFMFVLLATANIALIHQIRTK